MRPKILVCMPVYNEGNKAIRHVRNIPAPNDAYHIELAIIDDGSTDDATTIISNVIPEIPCPVHLIRNERNHGVGYSLRRGIDYALTHHFDFIVIVAGNGKDDLGQIPRLVAPLLAGTHDYVIGSRYLTGGSYQNLPRPRMLMMKAFTWMWRIAVWHKLTDATNGFRAYTAAFLRDPRMDLTQAWLDRYELEYYLQYKAIVLRYRVKEVAVSKDYPADIKKKKLSYTKIRPFIDWWKMIRPLVYLRLGIKR